MWDQFIISFLSDLTSGFLLALIIFISSYYIFKIPDLNGHWTLNATTLDAKFHDYRGMALIYNVLLWQEGKKIYGTGEKSQEKTSDGKVKLYDPGKRTHIEISGYINKKYHSRSL